MATMLVRTQPLPLKAGDPRVLIRGKPISVDFRVVSEELWQDNQRKLALLQRAYDKLCEQDENEAHCLIAEACEIAVECPT